MSQVDSSWPPLDFHPVFVFSPAMPVAEKARVFGVATGYNNSPLLSRLLKQM